MMQTLMQTVLATKQDIMCDAELDALTSEIDAMTEQIQNITEDLCASDSEEEFETGETPALHMPAVKTIEFQVAKPVAPIRLEVAMDT